MVRFRTMDNNIFSNGCYHFISPVCVLKGQEIGGLSLGMKE